MQCTPLRRFVSKGFQGILADAKTLPFLNNSFDYVIFSGLLHHLIGQGNLKEFLNEFVRVTQRRRIRNSIGAKCVQSLWISDEYLQYDKTGNYGFSTTRTGIITILSK